MEYRRDKNYDGELIEGIVWFDKGLFDWSEDLLRIDEVIDQKSKMIE